MDSYGLSGSPTITAFDCSHLFSALFVMALCYTSFQYAFVEYWEVSIDF